MERVPAELVLADWRWLHETGQLDEDDTLANRIRIAAPRIGMKVDALEQALRRAGIRRPVEPSVSGDMHHRRGDCQGCKVRDRACEIAESHLHNAARKLARNPDSPRLRAALERAQGEVATAEAQYQWHHDTEHGQAA